MISYTITITVVTSEQLTLTNVLTADLGAYTVKASNTAGEITSAQASLEFPQYHSADYTKDWKIGVSELTRFIQRYNPRNGTARTGEYHRWHSGDTVHADGFAPGS